MRNILAFLLQHGYAVLFGCVLAEQAGAPIPAVPVLLGVGALIGLGRLPLWPALLVSLAGCLISDSLWYWLGRRRGTSVLRILCAISLEPDSCVSTTKRTFSKLGSWSLLFAKFVPGLSTAAPPMSGVTKMPYWRFVLADSAGSLAWSGTFIAVGGIFRHEIEVIGESVMAFGSRAGLLVAVLLAIYIGLKLWQRERFLHSLRVARISAEAVHARLRDGERLIIVDLRDRAEMEATGKLLPGAVWYDRASLDRKALDIPRDRDVILYCS
jgi:membrane protein DedA with SNARE-associated domain